jgi:6-phosphogluconolactonase/glucosamine-6-phosphate isomerase/deaminase
MNVDLIVAADREDAAARAARLLADATHAGEHLVLAGGSTPRRAYELAALLNGDWGRAELWWGDGRCVPAEDERSNFRHGQEGLAEASHVVFLAVGTEKSAPLMRALSTAPSPTTPASLVRSRTGATTAIVDPAAASWLQ